MKLLVTAFLSLGLASEVYSTQFRVTNYDGPTTKTASGHRAIYGMCAADWNVYPPGTIIKLDTGERLIVADNGPAVKGYYHIDRYNKNHKIFPTISKGNVISRGKLARNSRDIYLAVMKGIKKKQKLDHEAKIKYYAQLKKHKRQILVKSKYFRR